MRSLVTCAVIIFGIGTGAIACKRDPAPAQADTATAVVEPAVTFVGRCVNTTAGNPNQSIFFFPKKGEMFLYMGLTGAVRVPVSIVSEEPRSMQFTFRWSEKDEPPSTHTGKVSAVGNMWQFDFDTLKASTCKPAPAPDFYKMLPELGYTAGKWDDPRERVGIVIAADARAWVLSVRGAPTVVHYRVIENGDSGTVVTSYGKTPGDADDESWAVTRMKKTGSEIYHELGDMKLHYKLTSAAPTLK
jgi:hypothetical protein